MENPPVEPIRIQSLVSADYDNDICSICHNDLEENVYTVPHCEHKFHSNCIISWFRTGNGSCPYCRNEPEQDGDRWRNPWSDRMVTYRIKRNYTRRKVAPVPLKKLLVRIQKAEKKQQDAGKVHSNWKKTDEGKEYSRLLKISRKYQRGRWMRMRKIRALRSDIGNYPIVPAVVRV